MIEQDFASAVADFKDLQFEQRAILLIKQSIHEFKLNGFLFNRSVNTIKDAEKNTPYSHLYSKLVGLVMGLAIMDNPDIKSLSDVQKNVETIFPVLWVRAYDEFMMERDQARLAAREQSGPELR